MRPSLTINAGLRYELQFPFYPLNSSYSTATVADLCGISGTSSGSSLQTICNLFQPGVLTGKRPEPTFLITKPFHPDNVKAIVSQALFFDIRGRPEQPRLATLDS